MKTLRIITLTVYIGTGFLFFFWIAEIINKAPILKILGLSGSVLLALIACLIIAKINITAYERRNKR